MRYLTATMTALGAIGATIALAAPQATAAVTSVGVERRPSFGSSDSMPGASCSYGVVAKTEPGKEVGFFDEVDGDVTHTTFQTPFVTADASGNARTTWTPAKRGQHKIIVVEYRSDDDYDVYGPRTPINVGTGINIGPTCVVLP